MEDKNKKKMCWNCEGNIPLNEDICPYCRAAIPLIDESLNNDTVVSNPSDDTLQTAITMALLMSGTFFFLFGSLLFFFSDNGYFVLRWSDAYWYLYFIVAIPMLYFGIQQLLTLTDEQTDP